MNRHGLKFLAGLIGAAMIAVPFLGLDNLPRSVRAQIDSDRAAIASAQSRLHGDQDEVRHDLQAEPELFATIPASRQWDASFAAAAGDLDTAGRDMAQLTALEKANRRTDVGQVQALLARERRLRTGALGTATQIRGQADHFVDLKRHLPDELAQMQRDYGAIQAFDTAPVAAAVQHVETDWPQKKADLDARLSALRSEAAHAGEVWQSTATERSEAAAGHFAGLNFGALFAGADALHATAANLPKQAADIQGLTGQLYNSWDKVLVDLERRGHGSDRTYDQKIRTIKTSSTTHQTTSDDQWVQVSRAEYDAERNDLGMAIAHKPAGKYDSEADHVAQPAGFAYMAPPGQRNQYGYWDHRDGHDFWVFYGQYALLRDLLFNHDYRPLDRGDWEGYRTAERSGQTYYGRDAEGGAKYGSQGTSTSRRYADSSYGKSGGFRDSQYASKSGSFRNSPYAGSGGDRTPHRFGSHPEEEPHFRPSTPRSFPRSFPRSMPRRFGRH